MPLLCSSIQSNQQTAVCRAQLCVDDKILSCRNAAVRPGRNMRPRNHMALFRSNTTRIRRHQELFIIRLQIIGLYHSASANDHTFVIYPNSLDMSKKSKVLVLCSRGVTHQDRHLMMDIRQVIPHSKKDCKFDKKDSLTALNELASLSTCDKCLYFENRKGKILLLWASNINGGPSVKFLVKNIHTMADIKLIGNCLRGSRPVLSFDDHFNKIHHLQLIKEIFIQIFNVPYKHPKSQPFVDHVVTFSFLDGHIWFRHYQILDQNDMTMAEIGPRMVLMPMLVLSNSFHGNVLWANFKRAERAPKKIKLAKASKKIENNSSDDEEDDDDADEQSDDDGQEFEDEETGEESTGDESDELDDIEKYR